MCRIVGLIVMDIDLNKIDFNACGLSPGNPGPSYLSGIDKCKKTTSVSPPVANSCYLSVCVTVSFIILMFNQPITCRARMKRSCNDHVSLPVSLWLISMFVDLLMSFHWNHCLTFFFNCSCRVTVIITSFYIRCLNVERDNLF